ncbi:MAG: FitA-like ribbon-helix-helix domain-containing protein [Tagaea sp.]
MKTITIRNVPEEDYRALRVRAAQNGRSMEAELRVLIEQARANNAPPAARPRLRGAALAEAIARVRADFASLGPMPAGWSAVDELIAERRAEAAREAAEP